MIVVVDSRGRVTRRDLLGFRASDAGSSDIGSSGGDTATWGDVRLGTGCRGPEAVLDL